jgi:hypothetical protein
MERVSVIHGSFNAIIVAPHGYDGDDENTGLIARHIAESINGYAVINNGWERASVYDYENDKADCNNAYHCTQDVVKDEFLDPIIRFQKEINSRGKYAYIYYIHGMGDKHRVISKDPKMDIVVGYGAGSPASHTCLLWQKDLLMYKLNEAHFKVYEGRKGGPMSGWARSNMNQYFRKWENNPDVFSMQLEIVRAIRFEKDLALLSADYIAEAIQDTTRAKSWNGSMTFPSY